MSAQHKSFIVAWMKESASEERREYYGGGEVRGNLLCPSVLCSGAVRVWPRLFCLVVFSVLLSLSHSLVNGCWFLRNGLPLHGIK